MRISNLATVTTVLLVSAAALAAQEGTSTPDAATQEQVYIDVDGAAVQVDAALAAEACGLDEAAALELAATKMEESGLDLTTEDGVTSSEDAAGGADAAPDESNETVTAAQGTADPSTSAPGDELLALAICRIDVETAAGLGILQANEIVTD